MGSFNVYGKTQLKAGDDLSLKQFSIGNKVSLKDGVYAGDNIVVVIDGIFVAEFPNMYSYHGEPLPAREVRIFMNSRTL